ncbi:MAG: penicillin-binding protein 1C [Candidatus Hatepunaea meridiana]|nr:penicillin-binding protein 1C [Candidatus Hatepunaea meridiana]
MGTRESLFPPVSTQILDKNSHPLRVYTASDDHYHFNVTLDKVSPYLISSTLAYEDRWFYYHPGLNVISVFRALRMNLKASRVVSGGSTITQQVARMMSPRPRTIRAKLIEALRALHLEIIYSKDEILEFYFNLAPYGGNIRGVAAASRIYFDKPPSELGPGEAALLAALPKSPSRLRPDRHPAAARERRNEVLKRMLKWGYIDDVKYELSLSEQVPTNRNQFPVHVPHLCDDLHRRFRNKGGIFTTTIDLNVQILARNLLTRHLEPLRSRGISNGSVVIIENKTNAVRALIGSADYFDTEHAGQVNGVIAPRSPGSTLKPFAYALSMDAGLITSLSLLNDVPISFSGYEPDNYDEKFHGVVTVETALTKSMNVPAVNLVDRLGNDRLYNFLKAGGFSTLTEPCEYYGLPIILGGTGVKLIELTNLYACLANGGKYRRYRVVSEKESDSKIAIASDSLLSSAASYILTDILSKLHRPDFPSHWESAVHLPKIAWKTGTSYGHRDAWSIGYNPNWTVGVWIGNFSGVGSPALVGADAATPLLFDLFTALEPEGGTWFERPPSVSEREVCAVSGMIPGEWCGQTRQERYIPNVSPIQTCNLHIQYQIDDKTGYRLCPYCITGKKYHNQVYVKMPQEVAVWLQSSGLPVDMIPSHNPNCRGIAGGEGPVITSPVKSSEYILRNSAPVEDQQICLNASVANDVKTIYWFVDGTLIYKGPPDAKVFYFPQRGRHEAVCMDDEGRKTSRRFVVK